ncbi:hypothetical protein [uncultured Polaribacter sp.]|uniref:hypothetical protein n=1 Tax=uncultured Polaribacter sp. TaxID=174711 RepID=UPI0026388403|nr:hypothetical protein [uncultured Polaribacter sp.]
MHKKLENDLMSLAHSLLKMKNKDDVFALKEKAQEIYEKLSLLAFVEEYVNTTPNLEQSKTSLINTIEEAVVSKELAVDKKENEVLKDKVDSEETTVEGKEILDNKKLKEEIGDDFDLPKEPTKEEVEKVNVAPVETEIEQPFETLEDIIFGEKSAEIETEKSKDEPKISSLEEELKDTIPVDVIANLFEPTQPKSLNNKLQQNINIGLNDRIAFVKHLFDGSQEDFNRVVSQLNTFRTAKEALEFINKMVKPDYNWKNKEDLENRFMEIIARKFA